jgi:tetratricopeptide (TPR) repeat protein
LEKPADARYQSGRALAEDLRRFVKDLPIAARRPNLARRMFKFVRRHKAAVTAVAAVVLIAVSAILWRYESAARRQAQVAQRIAQISSFQESATSFALMKQWANADRELRAGLKLNGGDTHTLLTLAWLKLEHFRADPNGATTASQEEVVWACRKILRAQSDNIKALGYLGIAQRRLEKYPEAIETLKRALAIDPDAYDSWSNLGSLHLIQRDVDETRKCLTKGAELAGMSEDRWHAAVWRNLGSFSAFVQDPKAAEQIANAILCEPNDVLTWTVRARLGLQSKDEDAIGEALDDAKHADRIAIFTNPRAKRIRAIAHLYAGESAQALEQARLAVELGDDVAINELVKSAAFAELGNEGAAQDSLTLARQTWPEALLVDGGYIASVTTGDLWIETAREWLAVESRAVATLGSIDH